MFETIVSTVLAILGVYAALGILFAIAFHVGGAARIDPATSGAGIFFRLLITPGVVALWPLLASRWRKAASSGAPVPGAVHAPVSSAGLRAAHRRLSLLLLVVVPVVAILAVALRPGAPPEDPAGRTSLPEPAALPTVAGTFENAFDPVEATVLLRTADDGARQVELELAADLGIPSIVLYWTPDGVDSFPRSAIFLGSVWGPGVRRYALPGAASRGGGTLVLYSMARAETVGSFTLP